jgi:hypothetical protein
LATPSQSNALACGLRLNKFNTGYPPLLLFPELCVFLSFLRQKSLAVAGFREPNKFELWRSAV